MQAADATTPTTAKEVVTDRDAKIVWAAVITSVAALLGMLHYAVDVGRALEKLSTLEKKVDEVKNDLRGDLKEIKEDLRRTKAGMDALVDGGVTAPVDAGADIAPPPVSFVIYATCLPSSVKVADGDLDAGAPFCLDAAVRLHREIRDQNEFVIKTARKEIESGAQTFIWYASTAPKIQCSCTLKLAPY